MGAAQREAPSPDRRFDAGPFDMIGDVHGCSDELQSLLTRLGYGLSWSETADGRAVSVFAPADRTAVFVGDLVNRGPDTPDVLRIVMSMVATGTGLCVEGNHEAKLAKWLAGTDAKADAGLQKSLDQIAAAGEPFAATIPEFLAALPCHLWLAGGALVVVHAGIRPEMVGASDPATRTFCLHGPATQQRDEHGLPVRVDWAADYRGTATIVYGHTPMLRPAWINETLCIDTGCVAGNRLTALRWPEKELVSVPARQVYSALRRPLTDPLA